ncbi:ATP-binding protein [Bremerella sp. JC770]|uniref:hybrid sensor histidine kinase/response regulator n=1 Tax=Bremerella sp. JC770 TaxID=3232137 RepID=UPI003459E810
MNRRTTDHESKGWSVSAKISLGFSIVLVLHISIAVLSHYGMTKSQEDLNTYGQLHEEVDRFYEIDRAVAALQRNVLLFAFTGYEGPEQRAVELQDQLDRLLAEAARSEHLGDIQDIQSMQAHLKAHREIFSAVEADRAKRRKLVNEDLQSHVEEFQHAMVALLENPASRPMAEEADAAFTAAQLNVLKFVNGPDSLHFREAKSQLTNTLEYLRHLKDSDDPHVQMSARLSMDAVDKYENAAIQMVQATRGYLHLVNVVLAGESVEFRRLAGDIRQEQIQHVSQLAVSMAADNNRFQAASNLFSVITIVLGIVAAWLIGRDVVPPLNAIADTFDGLAKGKKIEAIPALDRQDELGRLAMAAQIFKDKATETERLLKLAETSQQKLNSVNHELAKQSALAEKMAEDATAATVAKSEFLANMSHEIRTPMTAILGFAETLTESAQDEESQKAIETIQRNGNHLLAIINDILDLSKVESGKLTVERISACPYTLVNEVISLVQVKADGAGLKLSSTFRGQIPKSIDTDPTRLRQILINVLGNAIKFTEVGGVALNTEIVKYRDRAIMQFDIIDSGIGMSNEQISRLFQPFSQADSSMTRRFGGTGLGLTISKRLAAMLGGDLVVSHSQLGEGTSFRLTVDVGKIEEIEFLDAPAARALGKLKPQNSTDRISLQGTRLLLAEDGPDNQRLLKFVLNKAGAEVELVGNGQLAVDAALSADAAGTPYDCVLMDMQMPVKDGYEATQELRSRGYSRPILALTAHAMARDKQRCMSMGCDAFLTKPIDRKHLLTTVSHWSSKSSGEVCC